MNANVHTIDHRPFILYRYLCFHQLQCTGNIIEKLTLFLYCNLVRPPDSTCYTRRKHNSQTGGHMETDEEARKRKQAWQNNVQTNVNTNVK